MSVLLFILQNEEKVGAKYQHGNHLCQQEKGFCFSLNEHHRKEYKVKHITENLTYCNRQDRRKKKHFRSGNDEIEKKNAEVDAFIEGEKRKIMAVPATGEAEIKAKKETV